MRFCFPIRFSRRSTESTELHSIDIEGKVFEHFLELPNEGRMMIIDEMQADDRCRFTRCSKLSQKEAKASNNYIYGLEFYGFSENNIKIHIVHYEHKRHDFMYVPEDKRCGYILEFNGRYMRYFSIENKEKELWNVRLSPFKDIVHYAIRKFVKLVQLYQTKIKKLVMEESSIDNLKYYKFEIKNLKNLRKIRICSDIDILQFIPKIRKPMISMDIPSAWYEEIKDCRNLASFEQIYRVQTIFNSHHTKLNNQQFQRLSASWVEIDIGYLTEEDICNFVRSWQNGTIGKEVEYYQWKNIKTSSFKTEKLFRLLGVELKGSGCWIEHCKEPGKRAALSKIDDWDMISFSV